MCRFTALALLVCLIGLASCTPSPFDVEQSVRGEMQTKMGIELSALDLAKQPDGSYTGTATVVNGDVYEVAVDPPGSGRIKWRAVATQATIERMLRDHLEGNLHLNVKTMEVKKQPDGSYAGTATATNGDVYELTAGATSQGSVLNALVAQPTVERMVKEEIEKKLKAQVKSFNLTRHAPCNFTGTATLTNGKVLNVATKLEAGELVWKIEPAR